MGQLFFETSSLLGWLFESTIYISILICLILALKVITKGKLPVWWIYSLWLLLIFRMLIPWGIGTPLSVFNYVPTPPKNDSYMPYLMEHRINMPFIQNGFGIKSTAPAHTEPSYEPSGSHTRSDNSEVMKTADFDFSLDKTLLFLWFTGMLIFSIATIYKNLKFWLIIRGEKPISDRYVLDLFSKCISMFGIRKKVKIIVTDGVKSPAIFGYFKPQLLLPKDFFITLDKDELNCVFLHELGHLKRHDIAVSWLVTVFQIIYWFNPLVWHAFHHLRADQEAACDAFVLSKIKQVRPTDYAQTIVNLLERFVQNRQLPSLAGIIENRSQIDRRITMILNLKDIHTK